MLEYVRCNLCNSDKTRLIAESEADDNSSDAVAAYACTNSQFGKFGRIVQCLNCGLIYTNPRKRAKEILDNYERVIDPIYLQEQDGRRLTFERGFTQLERYAANCAKSCSGHKAPLLLDVGCYTGLFLDIARRRGWKTVGVEPCRWASEIATNELNLNVINSTLVEAQFPDASFDIVTLWDVIEHFTHPLDELKEINRILKPGGLVCLTTMNIASPIARLLGKRWWWLMEMHLFYFSPRTISLMLQAAGFKILDITSHVRIVKLRYLLSKLQHYTGWLSSVLDRVSATKGIGEKAIPINLGDLITVYAVKGQI